MNKLIAVTAVTLAVWCVPAFALVEIEPALSVMQVTPEGYAGYKGLVNLDIKSELGYSKATAFSGRIRAKFPFPIPNFYIQASPLKLDGTGSKAIPFQFGDQTFTANVPYTSSLKLDRYDFAVFFGVPFLETATLNKVAVDVGVNLRVIDFKAELTQPSTGLSQSKAAAIPVPMGYVGLRLKPIERLGLDAELRGVGLGSSRYVDFVARAKFMFLKWGFIAAGYRAENIKIDQNDIRTDLRFNGPLAELGIAFGL